MKTDHLKNYPAALPAVAAACAAEWSHLYTDWNIEAAIEEFTGALTDGRLPATLAAMEGAEILGTISLLFDDLPGFEALNPWLGTLFVAPDHRGRGVGAFLVREAEAMFRHNGFSTIYLFTETAGGFFQKLGWEPLRSATANGHPVAIFRKDVANGSATA